MKLDKKHMHLYAITDRSWTGEKSLYEQIEEALKNGVSCLQLREKNLDEDEFLNILEIPVKKVIQNMGNPPYTHAIMNAALFLYLKEKQYH